MTNPVSAQKKLITIISPAYNEEGNVAEMAKRLKLLFERHATYDFEVIIIENGCVDHTWERLQEVHGADARFKVIRLSRNFRMDGGLTAGMHYARGDALVMMACDLQDPPEMIDQFIKKWEEGYHCVYQIVTNRKGSSWMRRMNSQIFYWLINKLTGGMMPRNVSDFRLVDKVVYGAVRSMEERNRFVRGLFAWVGFKTLGLPCDRPERFSGTSAAHFWKVLHLALTGIFAHSYVPLRLITGLGLAVSSCAFILLGFFVVKALIWGVPFAGFGTIICVMLLMFGFLFLVLGIIGEYIGLIYEETKQRPNYIVAETLGL